MRLMRPLLLLGSIAIAMLPLSEATTLLPGGLEKCIKTLALQARHEEKLFDRKRIFKNPDGTSFDAAEWAESVVSRNTSASMAAFVSMRTFAGNALYAVAKAPISAPEKIAAYERLAEMISAEAKVMEQALQNHPSGSYRNKSVPKWEYRRIDAVGGGEVTIFVGPSGQIVEFHPDGAVYRVDAILKTGNDDPMNPTWKPPYRNGVRVPKAFEPKIKKIQ